VPACRHRFSIVLALLGLIAAPGGTLVAQQSAADQPPADAIDADPPTRAGRLSYVEGAVSVQPAGLADWSAAGINRPLASGDQLWSDRGSRAEIDLGSAILAVAGGSFLALLELDDEAVQLRLASGRADITLRDSDAGGAFEIDAPNAAVSLVRAGSYRITVDSAGNTTVALTDGQAQIVTRTAQSIILRGGQGARFAASGEVDVAPLGPADEFDRWCAQRALRWVSDQPATGYVSSEIVGAEDLADTGDWSDEPDYGYVWYPTQVTPDWAPYRYGRWLWVAPWGWTWMDNAPWGYAPFHYGRWAYLRQGWAWVPAPPGSRAAYAPALVAWMGEAGARDVGWLPLAPGEVYLPAQRVSARYLQAVNLTNTTFANSGAIASVYQNPALQRRYANRDAPRALSVVAQSSFTSGQPIAAHLTAPPPQWSTAAASARAPTIAASPRSVPTPGAGRPVLQPPVAVLNRTVLTRRPAAPRPGAPSALPARLVTPAAPKATGTPLTPEAARPDAGTPGAATAAPSGPTPTDRRVIPERSPHYQPPAQSHPLLPSPAPRPSPAAQPEAGAGVPVAPARAESFPAPAPAAAAPEVRARPAPPPERVEPRKVEPP
jgi:hypothetical protein